VCAQSFSRFSCSVLSVILFTKIIHSDIALSLTSLCGLLLSLCICHFSQIQIVGTCLDARHVPSLLGIPPREVETAWKHVKDMLVVLIDETRAAHKSMRTYKTDDGESGDWLAAASSASSCLLNKSSSNIADEEITLSRMRLQKLLSHKNPLTDLRRASSVVPWIALLGRKVLAVPATSAAPERMFSSTGNIMTKKRARLSCDHHKELMYLHEVWPKVREWTAIKKARLHSAYRPPTRARTHTNTHTNTQKTLWVVFPISSLRQTINTKKETDFTSETLSSCSTNIGAPSYDQVCIIIHPYQHRRMSGFLSFRRLNCILSFRNPNFFEHVHLEWTYSQVMSRVYYSSGVGLRLLVRLEKSLITKGPHRYV